MCSYQWAQCGTIKVLNVQHSMCPLWSNQCAHCEVINVLTVGQSMCPMYSNQCAHYGAVNVLSVDQSVSPLCTTQCDQYGTASVLNMGQSMCSVWSYQCAHCGAINMHQDLSSIHATVRQPKQSISNQLDVVLCMQQIEISCALSAILLCGVLLRVQQCQVLWRWGTDVFMFFSGCVAAYLRGMGKYNCGSSVRLHYRKKVSYYEWQVQVS